MDYLKNLDFTSDEIKDFEDCVPDKLLACLVKQNKLVVANISFLKDLGVTNYKEIFKKYYDLFLLDNSNFKEIFNKYEVSDLIEKLKKNINIVEFL